MSILVVGISHRGAPIDLLERVVPAPDAIDKLLADAVGCQHVASAVVLSSCTRVEIYAEVDRFHGGVEELAELLARHSGVPAQELTPHLYVRFEDGAVSHLFSVVCGLDSMVVGETQILSQVRTALRAAQDAETIGSLLNGVFQHALRVGKRAHTETDLGRAGRSVVSAALGEATKAIGDLAGRTALVVGAGSMSALAATTLHRDHRASVVVANRTPERARRLAGNVEGRAVEMGELAAELAGASMVVSCTGSVGTVLPTELLRAATVGREQPLVVVDIAMPRDVEASAAEVPGLVLIDLASLATSLGADTAIALDPVREIVAEEVAAFGSTRRASAVAPTVVALRSMAAEVVDAELRRLAVRVPDLDQPAQAEVARTVRRVVDKLLHTPTIRVKELAEQPVETSYTEALRELFALDSSAVEAFSSVEVAEPVPPGPVPPEPPESGPRRSGPVRPGPARARPEEEGGS